MTQSSRSNHLLHLCLTVAAAILLLSIGQPAFAQTGSISGTVTGSGEPLGRAFVQIYSSVGGFVTPVMTAADGSYTTPPIAAGNYYLRTSNSLGYVDQAYKAGGNVTCINCNPS